MGGSAFGGGGSKNLMQAKSEEGYVMIGVHPEGGMYEPCPDITLNRRDMRNKFGYTTLNKIMGEGNVLNAQRFS